MNVAAVIVTRGDVDLAPITATFPPDWQVVVWDNEQRASQQAVLGRWLALEETDAELIYVQDDDCLVHTPAAVMEKLVKLGDPGLMMCNMPQEFRQHYTEDALVGFGAAMHRDLPRVALDWFLGEASSWAVELLPRCCDIAVTGLNHLALCDVAVEHLPHAYLDGRMWKQPHHVGERARFRQEVLRVRHDH